MNTTVEMIKDYIKENYNLDFELKFIGTHRYLEYVNKKKKYELSCDYARQPQIDDSDSEYWSIYYDYMDRSAWYGNGGTYIDDGIETIDKIMLEWGFQKQQQMTIYDYLNKEV